MLPVALALACFLSSGFAGGNDAFAAVREADRQRIAATIAGNIDQLRELLSEELRYIDANDRVQTKHEFLASVADSQTRYLAVSPEGVALQSIAPGAVAMDGRVQIIAETAGHRVTFRLRFLAIWRHEAGHWRLLVYQSAPLATPEPARSK